MKVLPLLLAEEGVSVEGPADLEYPEPVPLAPGLEYPEEDLELFGLEYPEEDFDDEEDLEEEPKMPPPLLEPQTDLLGPEDRK